MDILKSSNYYRSNQNSGFYIAKQLSILMMYYVSYKVFRDSRPLLETIGSSNHNKKKALKQSMAFLKQSLEGSDVLEVAALQCLITDTNNF